MGFLDRFRDFFSSERRQERRAQREERRTEREARRREAAPPPPPPSPPTPPAPPEGEEPDHEREVLERLAAEGIGIDTRRSDTIRKRVEDVDELERYVTDYFLGANIPPYIIDVRREGGGWRVYCDHTS